MTTLQQPSKVKKGAKGAGKAAPAVILLAVLYYTDEIIFGAPVVATVAWIGTLAAFAIFVPIYLVFDYFIGITMLRIVNGELVVKDVKNPILRKITQWIQKWFAGLEDSSFAEKIQKTLSTKKGRHIRYGGFIIASYFGSAFITIPTMYLLGQRKYLRLLALFSATIYAVTFVGKYALGTYILLSVVKWLVGVF